MFVKKSQEMKLGPLVFVGTAAGLDITTRMGITCW